LTPHLRAGLFSRDTHRRSASTWRTKFSRHTAGRGRPGPHRGRTSPWL